MITNFLSDFSRVLLDDGEKNIEVARKAGLRTIRYLSNEQLFKELQKNE